MKTDLQHQHSSRKQGPIEIVADYGDLCGEGPLWDDQKQILYWTDIDGKKFYRYFWKERRHELVHDGFQVNGSTMQESRGFVVTNSSGIWLWDPQTKPTLLASEAEGKDCVMNDCIADPEGRFTLARTTTIRMVRLNRAFFFGSIPMVQFMLWTMVSSFQTD